jgi:hypothetical protein
MNEPFGVDCVANTDNRALDDTGHFSVKSGLRRKLNQCTELIVVHDMGWWGKQAAIEKRSSRPQVSVKLCKNNNSTEAECFPDVSVHAQSWSVLSGTGRFSGNTFRARSPANSRNKSS